MKIKNISMTMLSILAFNTIAEETQKTFIFNIPNSSKSFLVDQSNTEEPEQWIQIEDKIVKSPIYPLSSVTIPFDATNYVNYPNSGIYPVNLTYTGNIRYYTIKQERNNKTNEIREYPPVETVVTETNTFPTTYNIEYLTEYQFDPSKSYYSDKVYENNNRDENGNLKIRQIYHKAFIRTANIDKFANFFQLRNNINARIVINNITLQKTEQETVYTSIPNTSGWNCDYNIGEPFYFIEYRITFIDFKDETETDHYSEDIFVTYNGPAFSIYNQIVYSASELMTENDIFNSVFPFEGNQYKADNNHVYNVINNVVSDKDTYIMTQSRKRYGVCKSI